jgi:hypothetical protein
VGSQRHSANRVYDFEGKFKMKLDVNVNPGGPVVTVNLTFGFACIGVYEATLYDANDQNGKAFQNGTSTDNQPDLITLPEPASALQGRTLLIDAALVPPNAPDMVSVTADVQQGATALGTMTAKAAVGPGQKATPMLFIKFV